MPDKHIYEYAIIRLLPRVDRGECINVGVVLYCKALKWIGFRYELNELRLEAFSKETDMKEVKEHLHSFDRICRGEKSAGPIAAQDMASRFRWLTAKRSTVLQPSEIHPGYTDNPELALEKIFVQMVE